MVRRLSRSDRAWKRKHDAQERYRRSVRNRLKRAEALLQSIYDDEMNTVGLTHTFALTSRAREALNQARYALMNTRNR